MRLQGSQECRLINRPQIIYPQETVLRALATKINSVDADAHFAHLCEAASVRKAVLSELNAIGKAAGLRSLEVR